MSKDYDINLWDLSPKGDAQPKHIGHNEYPVRSVRFNKDGTMIVSGDNKGFIKIWDYKGKLMGKIKGHETSIYYVEFSTNSKYITSASQDGTIKKWSVTEAIKNNKISSPSRLNKPLEVLQGHTGPVNRTSFHPHNSQIIVSASDDGTVRIWKFREINSPKNEVKKIEDLLAQSCVILEKYLPTNIQVSPEDRGVCL